MTESTNKLVDIIGEGRVFLQDKFGTCTNYIRSGVDGFIRFEDCVKSGFDVV